MHLESLFLRCWTPTLDTGADMLAHFPVPATLDEYPHTYPPPTPSPSWLILTPHPPPWSEYKPRRGWVGGWGGSIRQEGGVGRGGAQHTPAMGHPKKHPNAMSITTTEWRNVHKDGCSFVWRCHCEPEQYAETKTSHWSYLLRQG